MSYASTNRIHDKGAWSDSAAEVMESGLETARETITSNPATAVMTAFGVGIGVGICLAVVLGRPAPALDYGLREKVAQFFEEHLPWSR